MIKKDKARGMPQTMIQAKANWKNTCNGGERVGSLNRKEVLINKWDKAKFYKRKIGTECEKETHRRNQNGQ